MREKDHICIQCKKKAVLFISIQNSQSTYSEVVLEIMWFMLGKGVKTFKELSTASCKKGDDIYRLTYPEVIIDYSLLSVYKIHLVNNTLQSLNVLITHCIYQIYQQENYIIPTAKDILKLPLFDKVLNEVCLYLN